MTAAERELIEMIRNTEDPEKALGVATDIIIQFLISENLVDDLVYEG